MNFGQALEALQAGQRVQRAGWNGKGMWLVYVPATPVAKLKQGTPYDVAMRQKVCRMDHDPITITISIDAHIDMFTARGTMQPGWLCSQADMLADDWQLAT